MDLWGRNIKLLGCWEIGWPFVGIIAICKKWTTTELGEQWTQKLQFFSADCMYFFVIIIVWAFNEGQTICQYYPHCHQGSHKYRPIDGQLWEYFPVKHVAHMLIIIIRGLLDCDCVRTNQWNPSSYAWVPECLSTWVPGMSFCQFTSSH